MAPISLPSQNPALQLQIVLAKSGPREGEASFSHVLESHEQAQAVDRPHGHEAPEHVAPPQAHSDPQAAQRDARATQADAQATRQQAAARQDRAADRADASAARQDAASDVRRDAAASDVRRDAAAARQMRVAAQQSAPTSRPSAPVAPIADRAAAVPNTASPAPDTSTVKRAPATDAANQPSTSLATDNAPAANTVGTPPDTSSTVDRLAAINKKISALLDSGADISDIADALTQAIADAVAALGDKAAPGDAGHATTATDHTAEQIVQASALLPASTAGASEGDLQLLRTAIKNRLSGGNPATSTADAAPDDATVTALLTQITDFFGRMQRRSQAGSAPPDDGANATDNRVSPQDDNGTDLDAASAKGRSTATQPILAELLALLGAGVTTPATTPLPAQTPAAAIPADARPPAPGPQAIGGDVLQGALQMQAPRTQAHAALGLADDAKGRDQTTNAASGPTGDDVLRVRTELPRAGSFAASGELLRTLERAANAAQARVVDLPVQFDPVAKIADALDRLSARIAQADPNSATIQAATSSGGDASLNYGSFANLGDGSLTVGSANSQNTSPVSGQGSFANALHAADSHDVMGQILSGVRIGEIGTHSDVRLTLTPGHLGEVSVHLRTAANHTVTALIVADSAEARQAILQSGDQLKSALADAGLKLASLDVNIANRDTPREAFQEKPQARRAALGAITRGAAAEDAPQVFGPSMLDRVNLQLLNQLV